jgi:hypothetical protein
MHAAVAKLIRKWTQNFLSSALVDREEGAFNKALAHHVFYGSGSENPFPDAPKDFQFIYTERSQRQLAAFNDAIAYLEYFGIQVTSSKLLDYFNKHPNSLESCFIICYFVR